MGRAVWDRLRGVAAKKWQVTGEVGRGVRHTNSRRHSGSGLRLGSAAPLTGQRTAHSSHRRRVPRRPSHRAVTLYNRSKKNVYFLKL